MKLKGERFDSGLQFQRHPLHHGPKITAISEATVAGTGGWLVTQNPLLESRQGTQNGAEL